MSNNIVRMPAEFFGDPNQNRPIFFGSIFIGLPDTDPEVEINRIDVILRQEDGTEVPIGPEAQPLLTGGGGYVLYQGSPVSVLVTGNYSIKVLNKSGGQEFFFDNVLDGAPVTLQQAVLKFDTLADAVESSIIYDTAQLNIAERTTGNGGGAMWDVVLSTTVTENTFNIVQAVGVGTLSLVLRVGTFVDPVQFGMVPDNTTDSFPAFVSANDYAAANNLKVLCTGGVFALDQTAMYEFSTSDIVVDYSACTLNLETVNHNAASSRLIIFSGDRQTINLGTVNATFSGSLTTTNPSVQRFLQVDGNKNDIDVIKQEGAFKHGILGGDFNKLRIRESIVNNSGVGHVTINGDSNTVWGCVCTGTSNEGVVINGGSGNFVIYNDISGMDETGIDDINGTNNIYWRNKIHDNTSSNVLARMGQNNFEATGFIFSENELYNATGGAMTVEGANTNAGGLTEQSYSGIIDNNNFHDNSGRALSVLQMRVRITNNNFDANNSGIRLRDGASYSLIEKNNVLNSTANGIEIETTSGSVIEKDITIKSNYLLDNAGVGIFIENGRNCLISDNRILASAPGATATGIELTSNSSFKKRSGVTLPRRRAPSLLPFPSRTCRRASGPRSRK